MADMISDFEVPPLRIVSFHPNHGRTALDLNMKHLVPYMQNTTPYQVPPTFWNHHK